MAGRTTRSKARDIVLETEVDTESNGRGQSLKPARKKRKGSPAMDFSRQPALKKAKESDSQGLLQELVKFPVDVLLEIFGHLPPSDLLMLARTTKALRSILMNRSSVSTWKKAIQNVGLPVCPRDLNEPQYAELAFGKTCDLCWRKLANLYPVWASRIRACKRCIETRFTPIEKRPWSKFNSSGYPRQLAEHLTIVHLRDRRYVDREIDDEWRAEYQAQQTKGDTSAWLLAMTTERSEISNHASECEIWEEEQEHIRAEEHNLLVKERKAIILERLKTMGWAEDLARLSRQRTYTLPTDLPEVHKACQKELTDQVLADLDEPLKQQMEKIKTNRLRSERKAFFKCVLEALRDGYNEYVMSQPAANSFPNTADIFLHPFVHDKLSGVHSPEALGEALNAIKPKFPEIVDHCLNTIQQTLNNYIVQAYTTQNHAFDLTKVKDLATTQFTCDYCRAYLTFGQAVAHYCRQDRYYSSHSNLDKDSSAVHVAIDELPWKEHQKVRFLPDGLCHIVQVFQSCGFDPVSTTATEMNNADPIFECLGCSNIRKGRATMRWLGLGPHFRHTSHNEPISVVVLPEHEAHLVRMRMLEQEQRDNADSDCCICIHCREEGPSMSLLRHAKQQHQVPDPVYGRDVILCPGVLPYHKVFYLWPPRM